MDVRVVILAAGASTRMGGRPKALTPVGGETALARMVAACAHAGLGTPVVVLGAHEAEVRESCGALAVEWVRNPRPEAGRTGSLKRALERVGASAALVWPVDHPLVAAGTLRLLADAPAAVAVPVHEGRRGHPIRLAGAALVEARSLADDAPLRDVVRRDPARVLEVPVDDPGVLANLDTPEDLRRAGL